MLSRIANDLQMNLASLMYDKTDEYIVYPHLISNGRRLTIIVYGRDNRGPVCGPVLRCFVIMSVPRCLQLYFCIS